MWKSLKIARNLAIPAAFIGILFVWLGDKFLPEPLSDYSKDTRTKISESLMGIIPGNDFERPSKEREELYDEKY